MADSRHIVYVTRDVDRALGATASSLLHIITNATPQASDFAASGGSCSLIEHDFLLSTIDLLKNTQTQQYFAEHKEAKLMVFKPTKQIERFAAENNWELIHPPAELAAQIEGKITGLDWLGELTSLMPYLWHGPCKDLPEVKLPVVAQFNISHTGNGTQFITEQAQLNDFAEKFPERPIRLMNYIDGPTLTSNIVVAPKEIIYGAISYQITGLKPFTDNDFSATIGNDFAFASSLLSEQAKKQYTDIAKQVAEKMRKAEWKGAFGIDCMWSTAEEKMYLLEINAREPASLSFESLLQQSIGDSPTIMDWHIAALLGESPEQAPAIINNGAQLVLRAQTTLPNNIPKGAIIVGSTINGTEYVRFRTEHQFMRTHAILNEQGQAIATAL